MSCYSPPDLSPPRPPPQEMQGALEGYLSHLSSISRELQSLQEQSSSLHLQLHNTSSAKHQVTAALDSLTLPHTVIQSVAYSHTVSGVQLYSQWRTVI